MLFYFLKTGCLNKHLPLTQSIIILKMSYRGGLNIIGMEYIKKQ